MVDFLILNPILLDCKNWMFHSCVFYIRTVNKKLKKFNVLEIYEENDELSSIKVVNRIPKFL